MNYIDEIMNDIFEEKEYDEEIEESTILTEAAVSDRVKIMALVAAGLALDTFLLVAIRNIKKRNDKASKVMRSNEYLDRIAESVSDSMAILKEKRDGYKKIMKSKDVSKEEKAKAKKYYKDINGAIRELKKIANIVARLAKEANVPFQRINDLYKRIDGVMKDHSSSSVSVESMSESDQEFHHFVLEYILDVEDEV